MSANRDYSGLPASVAAKRQSLDEWQQLLSRYPLTSYWSLGFNALTALSANLLTAWLLISGRMTPFELVLLVLLETVLLIGIALAQSRFVPPEALQKQPMGMRERLGTAAFGLVWLSAVYGLVLFAFVPSGPEIGRALRDPIAFLAGSSLRWPLLVTLLGAVVDAVSDAAHFRRRGGTFMSTPGFNGAARLLTLFLGGIPFFVPMVALAVAFKLVGERIAAAAHRRFGDRNPRLQILAILMIPVTAWLVLTGLGWLGSSLESTLAGVGWWALCYCFAKFVAELFVVCLPLIATQAHAEESAALQASVGKKPKSRLP